MATSGGERPIFVVQHQPSVPPGLITEVFEEADRSYEVIEAWRAARWPSPRDASGLVVMGGTMNVDAVDEHPSLKLSLDLVSEALGKSLPVLGVCLGSQMMAKVLGEPVVRATPRNAFFSPLSLTDEGRSDPLLRSFDPTVPVLQFHEDTFSWPKGCVPLAVSERNGLCQAFRFEENSYALQFHFEVDREIVAGWCDNIGPEDMVSGWGTSIDELMSQADLYIDAQGRAGRAAVRSWIDLIEGR